MLPIQCTLSVLTQVPSVCSAFLQVAKHIGGALISIAIRMGHGGLGMFAKDMRREHSSVKKLVVFTPVLRRLFGLQCPFESRVGILQ